jgi:dTDP-glucose 4,6-dehydratase
MRVLVFGGLGFMGSNFVNWCRDNRPDWETIVVDAYTYSSDTKRLAKGYPGQIIRGDLRQPQSYRSVLFWADLVVNFAAETHNDNSLLDPAPFLSTNVLGLFELIQLCREHSLPIIQISTDEVYGDFSLDSTELATEEYPFRPSSPYSSSKAAGDLMIMAWVRSFGLKAMVTHSTNNFGPGQHQEKFVPTVIESIENDKPIQVYGSGLNVRDWLHVSDHSSAIAKLIESGTWGERYNISAYNQKTNLDVVEQIKFELGLPNHPVEFIRDRAGHDLRYGLDSEKIRSLGWFPETTPGARFANNVLS